MMNRMEIKGMLKKTALFSALCAACSGSEAFAREGVGVGLIVGEPTGVSLKYWLDRSTAIDAALAVN